MSHLKLVFAFLVIGYIFTHKLWLNWLARLSPEMGLVVKQVIIAALIYNLHHLDGSVRPAHVWTLGVYLIYLAFQIIFNYQSKWIRESGSDPVDEQTPDGVLYHNARHLTDNMELARILTFVVVPALLVFAGGHVLRRGQRANLD